MKKLFNIMTKRAFISSMLFIVEIITLTAFMIMLEKNFINFWLVVYIVNIISSFTIVNFKLNNAFKISWLVLVILLPIVGAILFLIFGKKQTLKKTSTLINLNNDPTLSFEKIFENSNISNNCLKIMQWTYNVTHQPTYSNTETTFLNSGEVYLKNLLIDLKQAKKSIYLEFFIICTGYMWSEILNILLEKAKNGVDVRLIYDDLGTVATLPKNYDKWLNQFDIKTKIFNKIKFKINSFMNNRDHRKIVIIDNNISYTGGINIADEYINKKKRFGFWQDSALKIKGPATQTFTELFLNMWHNLTHEPLNLKNLVQNEKISVTNGLVMPFGDNPRNKTRLNNTIYLKIINNAKHYIYIQTPYLVMDEQLTNAIICAAQSCVKIIIITPHIFDKFYVHTITQDSYANLIESGVKIFEYSPGFIHSKMIIADDEIAVLGTANFDYRSLYMQFESSVLLYKTKSIKQMTDNFKQVLKKSKKISIDFCKKTNFFQKIFNFCLKPFITFL